MPMASCLGRGAMRAISRVSHTFAWRGHDRHRHRIMGMTLPSCPRHHAPTIHRSCMSVLRKKSGSGARRSARERAGASAPLARFRGHRRGNKLRGNSIPHAPSPTSNDARSHDPHRNATVTAPHRPKTPPARRPRTSTRRHGNPRRGPDDNDRLPSELWHGSCSCCTSGGQPFATFPTMCMIEGVT